MSLLAPAIAAGAALLTSAGNNIVAGKMNKRAIRFQREMFEKQGQRELDYWNMQNQYNLPAEQMKRLKDAGLNPNLVYNNGADAQGATLKAGGAPSMPSQVVPQIDFTSIAQTALATKQLQANIDRTNAETERIKQGTEVGQFELEAMKQIGQSEFTRRLQTEMSKANANDEKQINEYANWLEAAYPDADLTMNINMDRLAHLPLFGSKMVQDSIKATTQKALEEVKSIKAGTALRNQQQSINQLDMVIKRAEAEFTKSIGSVKGAGLALQLLRTILGK